VRDALKPYVSMPPPVPRLTSGNRVSPLIDGAAYNAEVAAAIAAVGTGSSAADNAEHVILVANWWLGLVGGRYVPAADGLSTGGPTVDQLSPYLLDGPGGKVALVEELKAKARAGVDVRVMAWASFPILGSAIAQKSGAGSIAGVNALSVRSITDLRTEPAIGGKAILNIMCHAAGAVHAKVVLVGRPGMAVAFTGGIDFVANRWAHEGHAATGETWHDVVAKVEGPAVDAVFEWFRDYWNENVFTDGAAATQRRAPKTFRFAGATVAHVLDSTPKLDRRTLHTADVATHHVYNLRTVPRFNYKFWNIAPTLDPLSFAPDGVREVQAAWRAALVHAKSYVYMEDQAFWSQEVMSWINEAIKAAPSLRVVLVGSGASDPNDPAFPEHQYHCQSINHGLLEGLTAAQLDQVRMFRRWADPVTAGTFTVLSVAAAGPYLRVETNVGLKAGLAANALGADGLWVHAGADGHLVAGNEPVPDGGGPLVLVVQPATGGAPLTAGTACELLRAAGLTVHSKTTLVDDEWAVIGSANCMRRSLYTDGEHAIAFLDENGDAVRDYRKRLWAEHFGHAKPDDFHDLQGALHAWDPGWGVAGAAPPLPVRPSWDLTPPRLARVALPFTPDKPQLDEKVRRRYDLFDDADSTNPWGVVVP
jgi:phosphatidylserine/phosphatidylglycerophosphate/cardiolipin synthase-like enzyme